MPSPKTASKSGPHHARSQRTHKVLRAIGLVTTAGLAFGVVGGAAAYMDWQSAVTVSDVSALVDPPATPEPPRDPDDPYAGKALNILVMGTDYRDEENAELAGAEEGMRSDTTFVVHISGDRSRIEVVSIPRDSLVDIPACNLSDGRTTRKQTDAMFNSAFEIGSGGVDDMVGAAACTITTVQDLTGLTITDHVVVKMTGVIGVVDALGGVRMCFPEPVVGGSHSRDLNIAAGEQVLDGRTSISFLRARKGSGMGLEMGSDLARIARQQAFMDSMMRELLSKNIITDTPQLYGLIKAVLSSISASPNLAGLDSLAGLAFSLKDIEPSEIVFTPLPVVESSKDKNRVVWTKDAQAIWDRMAADEPPPGHETPAPPADGGAAAPDTGATVPDTGATVPDAGATVPDAGTTGEVAPPADTGTTTPPPLLEGVCAS
ncbi:MAG: transcriptional regulator [Oerskovia sp.]|jgi:LCP family protein required for cell wall assembly|nr:transcriptional regulator [Oerskovia sp.]